MLLIKVNTSEELLNTFPQLTHEVILVFVDQLLHKLCSREDAR